jgi:hypothetical protein
VVHGRASQATKTIYPSAKNAIRVLGWMGQCGGCSLTTTHREKERKDSRAKKIQFAEFLPEGVSNDLQEVIL